MFRKFGSLQVVFFSKKPAFLPTLHFGCLSLAKCGAATNVKATGTKIMMPLIIRCFHNKAQQNVSDSQFFILSKGSNAGKPGLKSWTNSFIATASNEEMSVFYLGSPMVYTKRKALRFFTTVL